LAVAFGNSAPVLEEFSLRGEAGEFLALVGPSGCGKSTFLRCLAGLQQPTSGRLSLESQEDSTPKPAYVFQSPTLLPWRDVIGNIGLPLELAGRSRRQCRSAAEATLRQIGLRPDDARKRPRMLSGGMQMRVSLARALVTRPDLMLLDEPFAALDDISRQQLNEELMSIWMSQGWTAVFVTHNVAEAVFLSQRILVMSQRPGQIHANICINLPYPRLPEIRGTAEFAGYCGEVARTLREATTH
jgi:NitT/TauT family transport system ATP-binding protein